MVVGDIANGTAVVTVSVPVNATGNVTLRIDGMNYTAEIDGDKAIINLENLTAGAKTFIVEYAGDDNYAGNYAVGEFDAKGVKVSVDSVIIDNGDDTVVVVVGDNATGNVTIKVGDKEFNATVVNGTAVVNITNVTPGDHTVEVIYSGDGNHTNSSITTNISAPKYDTPINVTVGEAREGEPIVITVEVPKGATCNVIVSVGGKDYNGTIKDGKAVVTAENVSDGDHTIAVVYLGDENYAANTTISNMTVQKAKSETEPSVVDYGNGTVVVVVGDNATGNVTVKVGDHEYNATVINGTAVVTVDNVTPGVHDVEVIYSGDENHANSTVETTITAPKYDSDINVTVSEVKEGETAVITVKVPSDARGNVTVYIDGKNYTAEVKGGVATVEVENITGGAKTVTVEYSGDENYSGNYTILTFDVEKEKETPGMIIEKGNNTVIIHVGDNATGNVTVKVGNETYNATIINGTAVIPITNTTPGEHDIEVIYSGDDNHNATTVNTTISVDKYETPISINAGNINVGDKAVITVNVPDGAKGTITIEIDGVKYTEEIKDGAARFEVENLTAGVKSVFAVFEGDSNYTRNFTTDQFNVSKVDSNLNVEIKDINVGENVTVTVHVPKDATGQVLVDINGVGYYVNITDGAGTIEIPYLPSGEYDINLTYTGDDKYLPISNSSAVKVSKLESFVIPIAHNIEVGENENIQLIVPADATGTVTVVIDGEEFNFNLNGALGAAYKEGEKYTVAISGGKGELVITGLPKGEYIVSVRYNGDNKYMPVTNSTIFTVSKEETQMEIVDLGNGTVLVILSENATGTVTLSDGNNTYTANVVDGVATFDLNDTTPGMHDFIIKYSGDKDHSSNSTDVIVDIPKYETPISVSVSDVNVGDVEIVTVTVPDNATGKVTIEINGKEYVGDVKDGKAIFNVSDLAFGNKTVAVKYSGNDIYRDNYTTGQFKVSKVSSTVKATSKDSTVGKDEVITATVPADATGRVLVDINGVGYYGNVVGDIAKIIIPELPSGKYTAKVTYEGDDKYLPCTTVTSFTVSKSKAPISAEADDID